MGLIEAHRGILYRVANGYCRERQDRPDLIQEIVLQLWRAWPDYRPELRFSTWMYRISLNVAISHYRRQSRRWFATVPLEETGVDLMAADEVLDESGEDMRLLHRLIRELEPLNRALILLFLEGEDNRAIAEILGISTSSVSTRLNRLKSRLMREFDERSE